MKNKRKKAMRHKITLNIKKEICEMKNKIPEIKNTKICEHILKNTRLILKDKPFGRYLNDSINIFQRIIQIHFENAIAEKTVRRHVN